jgi:hypothetical protein
MRRFLTLKQMIHTAITVSKSTKFQIQILLSNRKLLTEFRESRYDSYAKGYFPLLVGCSTDMVVVRTCEVGDTHESFNVSEAYSFTKHNPLIFVTEMQCIFLGVKNRTF